MVETPRLGARVRAIRKAHRLTQVRLAEQLGISPSYLNLIEHNRRPLPAALLLQLAKLFDLELDAFEQDDAVNVKADLMEVFGDDLFDDEGLTGADVDELVQHHPNVARAIRTLYDALYQAREQAQACAGDEGDPVRALLPSDEVSAFLQERRNHFPELEAAAESLSRSARLEPHHMQQGLVAHLAHLGYTVEFVEAESLRRAVRRIDRERKVVSVSELLRPRSRLFQLAHAVGLLTRSDILDDLVEDPGLTRPESRRLARVALCNYFAGAVLMPYEDFLTTAEELRYDIERIGHRFRVSFEQVCHRLTTLSRPGREGVAFHLIRTDIAGNISKRFSASGIRFARYSGVCPRWNVFGALLTPGRISTQISVMPEGDAYFCIARTIRKGDRGYHTQETIHSVGLGCRLEDARALVYADGIDLDAGKAVPIGVTCRACPRRDCEQRAMPSAGSPLQIDEDVRGMSFYAAVDSK
ncbi:MAG: DUF2083 domain-containing protein [Myxococcales bacterium]|nr:DUF2083 domain-containing protein [Myxococcales bacterium]MCB9671265.1 DUF2083 domain-containing protein [Alphaproteobacteria bacterium]